MGEGGGIMDELMLRFGVKRADGKVFRRKTFNNYCRHECLTAQKVEESLEMFDCCRKMNTILRIVFYLRLKVCQNGDMFKAKHGSIVTDERTFHFSSHESVWVYGGESQTS